MTTPIQHLYVHIPFCPAKCSYCAFVSHIGSTKLMEPYLEAVRHEASAQHGERPGGPLRTIYFGGGTPSMMTPRQLDQLIVCFDRLWDLDSACEITIEAHPSTIDAAKLNGFVAAGANRLSMGVESLQAEELRLLGRTHDLLSIARALHLAKMAGFKSVGLDLMYGIPAQTMESWSDTLRTVCALGPDHLSLYPLQIEDKTIFGRRWRQHELQVPDDARVVEMYHRACEVLRGAGYLHYEVANWARPGHQCEHNLSYWRNREYYAVGVGAHGYLRPYRVCNVRHTKRYIDTVLAGASPRSESILVDEQGVLSESLMLGLRLLETGIDLDWVGDQFGEDARDDVLHRAGDMLSNGMLHLHGRRLIVAERAVPVANDIWARFV